MANEGENQTSLDPGQFDSNYKGPTNNPGNTSSSDGGTPSIGTDGTQASNQKQLNQYSQDTLYNQLRQDLARKDQNLAQSKAQADELITRADRQAASERFKHAKLTQQAAAKLQGDLGRAMTGSGSVAFSDMLRQRNDQETSDVADTLRKTHEEIRTSWEDVLRDDRLDRLDLINSVEFNARNAAAQGAANINNIDNGSGYEAPKINQKELDDLRAKYSKPYKPMKTKYITDSNRRTVSQGANKSKDLIWGLNN